MSYENDEELFYPSIPNPVLKIPSPSSEAKKERYKTWYHARKLKLKLVDYRCECGFQDKTRSGRGLVVHHIHERIRGGDDSPENLQVDCRRCYKSEEVHAV